MEPSKPTPRLISEGVYEFAEHLKQGTLPGATFHSAGFAPNDPKMVPYLEAVAAGDEPKALKTLANTLAASPLYLWHPYVQSTALHLFTLFSQFTDLPKEFRDQVNTALDDLVVAWAYGLTGRDVSVRTSYAKRGRTSDLFPALDERDGAFLTPEALTQRQQAWSFVELVEDLKTRFGEAVRWRDLRNQYRESSVDGKAALIDQAAEDLRVAFAQALEAWNQSTSPPAPDKTREIAQKALSVPHGRNPNDTAAYEFLALYPAGFGGRSLKLTPSLIKNTLSTLAKRGIPPNVRSRSKKQPN